MGARRMTVMECDAPGCLVARPGNIDERAEGYYLGRILIVETWGGASTKPVYACQLSHIEPAVQEAIREALER